MPRYCMAVIVTETETVVSQRRFTVTIEARDEQDARHRALCDWEDDDAFASAEEDDKFIGDSEDATEIDTEVEACELEPDADELAAREAAEQWVVKGAPEDYGLVAPALWPTN